MRAIFYGPLIPRLTPAQLAFAEGEETTLSDDDYARLTDLWRQGRRSVPCVFRSPMEKWLSWVVSFERRAMPTEVPTDGV
jgi:hypothetical protein